MTKDELKLAFQKAFQMGQDYWYHANHEFESYNKKSDAIRAKFNEIVKETIEEALAQPEQEPVAWRTFDGEGGYDYRSYEDNESYADEWDKRNPNHKGWVDKLYTTPPPCPTCEALARTVMMDQTGRDA